MWYDIYQQLKLREYKSGEHVFNYNDDGDTFYIILQGTCAIRIPKVKDITWTQDYIEKYIRNNLNNLIGMNDRVPETYEEAKARSSFFSLTDGVDKRDYRIRYLETIKVFGKGQHFGELALIISKPRSATVTWKTDTKLAYLSKHEYQKILGHAEYRKMQEVTAFFK